MNNLTEDQINYLLSPLAIRETTRKVYDACLKGDTHFNLHLDKIDECVDLVIDTINEKYGVRDFAAGYIGYYVCNDAVIMQKFGDRLRQAKADLEVSFELFPSHDPVVYTGALTLVRGLQEPIEKLDDYLEKLKKTADPYHVPAHLTALQAQCQKWRGSHNRMFAYAGRVTKDLPAGHPLWVLIPQALYERTLLMGSNAARAQFRGQHPELRR